MKWKENNIFLQIYMLNEKEPSTIGKCYAQVNLGCNFIRNFASKVFTLHSSVTARVYILLFKTSQKPDKNMSCDES